MRFHVFARGFARGKCGAASGLICIERLATGLVRRFTVFLTFSAVTVLAGPSGRAEQNRTEDQTKSEGCRQFGLLSHYTTSFINCAIGYAGARVRGGDS